MRRRAIRQGEVVSVERLRAARPERSWQREGDELALLFGWTILLALPDYVVRCACGRDVHWGRSVAPGWPDRVYARRGPARRPGSPGEALRLPSKVRLVAVEYKSADGRLEVEQRAVLALLEDGGVETYVVGPGDADALRAVLR